jgi:hypothetical protein
MKWIKRNPTFTAIMCILVLGLACAFLGVTVLPVWWSIAGIILWALGWIIALVSWIDTIEDNA